MKAGQQVSAHSLVGADLNDLLFLDVRTPGEFRGHWIADSLNVPLGDLARRADELRTTCASKSVPYAPRILAVSHSPGVPSSSRITPSISGACR